MHKRHAVAGIRLFFGLLTLTAVAVQYVHLLRTIPNYNSLNFFSFFTIESNIFAGVMLIMTAFLIGKKKYIEGLQLWRGAATLYMTITGIVYALLLSGINVDTSIQWVNVVLHYILPVVMLADWLLVRPRKPIAFRRALVWLVFPVVYLAYSLVRGAATGWYPYPFLNPGENGYAGIAVVGAGIMLAALALTWALSKAAGKIRTSVDK